jgi:hypothetical protein
MNEDFDIIPLLASGAINLPSTMEYLEIRPIQFSNGHDMSGSLEEPVEGELRFGGAGGLLEGRWYMENLEAAIEVALMVKEKVPPLRLQYSDETVSFEFTDWRSLLLSFALAGQVTGGAWYIIEQLATGVIKPDHPVVIESARHDPILAAAIASGTL